MNSEPLLIRRSGLRWQPDWTELWRSRDLVLILGGRDIKLRYRQTLLGVLWVVAQPLIAAAVFAFVFGRVARLDSGGVPYFPFALAGATAWSGFGGALTRASGSLVQNPQLISKVFFPRMVLPLSALVAVLLDLAIGVALLVVVVAAYDIPLTGTVLTLPIWLLLLLFLALGIGLFAAALAVRYRDVQHVLPVVLQIGFYATPVAYSLRSVPERYHDAVLMNPVATLMEATRWSLFGGGLVPSGALAFAAATAVGCLWAGAVFFRNAERSFADAI